MKMKTHSVYIRMMSLLLAVLCIVGLFPASALAASPNTIKLEDCTYNGVHYDSPALGICYMHQMQFDFNGDSVMGFCSEKGKGMGWSLEGHEWNSPKEINDSTVKIMMAYFYCHTKGIFTDRAQALGLDEVWGSDYTWTMNAWVQAVVWRYKAGLLSDPVVACAEELMYVFNNLKHTNYTSIDEELDGWSFRDRAQYTLDLGAEGVWGDCAVYEYKYAGPGSNYHPANDVQAVFVGELTITREQYELILRPACGGDAAQSGRLRQGRPERVQFAPDRGLCAALQGGQHHGGLRWKRRAGPDAGFYQQQQGQRLLCMVHL